MCNQIVPNAQEFAEAERCARVSRSCRADAKAHREQGNKRTARAFERQARDLERAVARSAERAMLFTADCVKA